MCDSGRAGDGGGLWTTKSPNPSPSAKILQCKILASRASSKNFKEFFERVCEGQPIAARDLDITLAFERVLTIIGSP